MQAAAFDPLALLEAEYAAVLAQSRPSGSDDKDAQPHDDDDARSGGLRSGESGGESEEEEEGEEPDATYSLLPSSPGGGFASDDGEEEAGEAESDGAADKQRPAAPGSEASRAPEMPADKRQAIMQAMQKLQLQPPAWAAASRVSDEQLVAMVQRQLQSKE